MMTWHGQLVSGLRPRQAYYFLQHRGRKGTTLLQNMVCMQGNESQSMHTGRQTHLDILSPKSVASVGAHMCVHQGCHSRQHR